MNKKQRKLKERELKMLEEGKIRQLKYAKMLDLTKSGHCKAQFLMMEKFRGMKKSRKNK